MVRDRSTAFVPLDISTEPRIELIHRIKERKAGRQSERVRRRRPSSRLGCIRSLVD